MKIIVNITPDADGERCGECKYHDYEDFTMVGGSRYDECTLLRVVTKCGIRLGLCLAAEAEYRALEEK